MQYTKPEVGVLAPALRAIGAVLGVKWVPLFPDSYPQELYRPSVGAYEADE